MNKPPHVIGQRMVEELQQRTPPAASGVYRRAAEQDDEPTLPSARSASWFAHPDELPLVPLWRVLVGMLLLGE